MKVLFVNKFLFPKGGDAICTLSTGDLLRRHGHEVTFWGMKHQSNPAYPHEELFVDNIDLNDGGGVKTQLMIAGKLLYSFEAKRKLESLLKKIENPDIVHLHNFAHQISPSIIGVFKKNRIPVVMTMHDYKMVCAPYTMLSNGKVCEKCKNGKYYHCFNEGCVKDSRAKSLLNTIEMYLHHTILHVYDHVHTFISPSAFLKAKVEEMGFKGRVVHITNCIDATKFVLQYEASERSIVYFGRLSYEKGVGTLIEAMRGLDITLKIIGDGPIRKELEVRSRELGVENVRFLGYRTGDDLKNEIRSTMAVVIPSEWYENNPLSVIEAFALGKPVIGARIGGIPELVRDNKTGMTFTSGDSQDLRSKIIQLMNDQNGIVRMGKNARIFVEKELNEEVHYQRLMEVYQQAIDDNKK